MKCAGTGYKLLRTCDEDAFFEIHRHEHPLVVVMDQRLVDEKGAKFFLRLDYSGVLKRTYTLMLSADKNGRDVYDCLARGAADFAPIAKGAPEAFKRIRQRINYSFLVDREADNEDATPTAMAAIQPRSEAKHISS